MIVSSRLLVPHKIDEVLTLAQGNSRKRLRSVTIHELIRLIYEGRKARRGLNTGVESVTPNRGRVETYVTHNYWATADSGKNRRRMRQLSRYRIELSEFRRPRLAVPRHERLLTADFGLELRMLLVVGVRVWQSLPATQNSRMRSRSERK